MSVAACIAFFVVGALALALFLGWLGSLFSKKGERPPDDWKPPDDTCCP